MNNNIDSYHGPFSGEGENEVNILEKSGRDMSGVGNRVEGGVPFKNFAMDPALAGMYTHLAASGAMSPGLVGGGVNPALMNPFAAAMSSAVPFGFLESHLAINSSFGQYLAQKKRRSEAAQGRKSSQSHNRECRSNGVVVETEASVATNGSADPEVKTDGGSSDALNQSTSSDDAIASSSDGAKENGEFSSPSGKTPTAQNTASNSPKTTTNEIKDASYWERRRKNNEAAKRSRDSRRRKEEEIAVRAAFLEQENLKLKTQIAVLKAETTKLHCMLYQRL